jgi:hypothetical protein
MFAVEIYVDEVSGRHTPVIRLGSSPKPESGWLNSCSGENLVKIEAEPNRKSARAKGFALPKATCSAGQDCFEVARQEQIQMISSAIGRPVPRAPPIIKAKDENKFSAASSRHITVTPSSPQRASTRRPRMNDKTHASGQVVTPFDRRHLPGV